MEVKYPDRDDYPDFGPVLEEAQSLLNTLGQAIVDKNSASVADLDSFCDWYLVSELTNIWEPNHPKSCYVYYREGTFYAGPVWDFDWGTFLLNSNSLRIRNCMYYKDLFKDPAFAARIRERWAILKPRFQTLGQFVDAQADWIRASEAVNHALWPLPADRDVNHDEQLSFQDAVDRMKLSIEQRIVVLDREFGSSGGQ